MSEEAAKKLRLKDFEERKRSDPSSVYFVSEYGWEYISVHPMSDEVEILKGLGIKPEECVGVDCYWSVNGDIVFLQVYSKHFLTDREPGFYAQLWTRNLPRLNLSAYLDELFISRSKVEEVMVKFYKMDLDSERFSPAQLTERLALISR